MKGFTLMVLLLLGGCGTLTSLEELEATAMLTGDWSAVEERERIIEKRKLREGPRCPVGSIAVCQVHMANSRCNCVKSSVVRSMLSGR